MARNHLFWVLVLLSIGCTLQDESILLETSLDIGGRSLIASDEHLYTSSLTTRCLDWKGNIIWETETPGGCKMVLAEDALFLNFYDHSRRTAGVRLLNLEGEILWQKDLGSSGQQDIDASDNLLAASVEEILWAFSLDGSILWEYVHPSPITKVAVAADSSHILFFDCYSSINCVQNASLLWSQSTTSSGSLCTFPEGIAMACAPDNSYIVYGSERNGCEIVAATLKGETIWAYQMDSCPRSVVITGDSQSIVVGSSEHVCKFTFDGTLLWEVELPGDVNTITTTPDGTYIAVGSDVRKGLAGLFAVFSDDGTLLWKTKTLNIFKSIILRPDGNFAAFSIHAGKVYLFHNPPEVLTE